MAEGYNMRSPAVKRLMREALELKDKNEQFFAQPLEDNLFEWHFTIRGPSDSEFDGGIYHGRIILPAEYPMKPPSIILLTPSGRFETGKKICLSISGYHPETWQPSWSLRTALLAIIGFMTTHGNGAIGSLDYSPEERKILAKKSQDWKCPHCGNICDLVLPVTEASQKLTEEAKELGAQINLQGERPKINDKKENINETKSEDASSSISPTPNAPVNQPSNISPFPFFQGLQFPPQFPPQFLPQFPPQFGPQFSPQNNVNGNQAQNYQNFFPQYPTFNPLFGFPPRPQSIALGNFPLFPPFLQGNYPTLLNQNISSNVIQSESNIKASSNNKAEETAQSRQKNSTDENLSAKNAVNAPVVESRINSQTGEGSSTALEKSQPNEQKSTPAVGINNLKTDSTDQTSQPSSVSPQVKAQHARSQETAGPSTSSGTGSQSEVQMNRTASAQALLQGLRQRLVVPPTDLPRLAPSDQLPRNRFLPSVCRVCLDGVVIFCVVCITLLMIRRMYLTIIDAD